MGFLGEPPVSVVVRRRAATRGIDLATMSGSGPGGLVRLIDVERASPTLPPREPDAAFVPRIPVLAALPALSPPRTDRTPDGVGRTVTQLTSAIEVDTSAVDDALAADEGSPSGPDHRHRRRIALIAAACTESLATHPRLTTKAFALIDTGAHATLYDTPMLAHPLLAALAVGAGVRRPVVVQTPEGGESISIRSITWLTLAYDADALGNADAAGFLAGIKNLLETPDVVAGLARATSDGS